MRGCAKAGERGPNATGSAQRVSPADFARIAADAKETCPVSKALAGPAITLEVTAR